MQASPLEVEPLLGVNLSKTTDSLEVRRDERARGGAGRAGPGRGGVR